MKRIIITVILIFVLTNNLQAEKLELNYNNEVFIDNNAFSLGDLLDKDYDNLKVDIDSTVVGLIDREERVIVSATSGNYFIGYIKESEEKMVADEETAIFLIEREADNKYSQGEYQIDLNTFSQSLEGILFGAKILSNDNYGINFTINGKLLKGIELTQRNYQGISYSENDKYYISGTRKGVYSNLTKETNMYDVDFSSRGYSLGYNLEWQISNKYKLSLVAENFYSKIKWNDVYTLYMKLDDNSLGFYTKLEDNYGSIANTSGVETDGRYDYIDYVTHLQPEYNLLLQSNRWELGLFYRRELYPYLNYNLLKNPIMLKAGIYKDFISISLIHKILELELKTKEIDIFNSSGLLAKINININF
jgi:hypothetical protein